MVVELNYLSNLLKRYTSYLSDKPIAAISGFDTDYNFAQLIKYLGYRVLAVSDKNAALVDYSGNGGLDVFRLSVLKKQGLSFSDLKLDSVKNTKPDFLVKMEVDILIVQSRAAINEGNADDVRARIVLKAKEASITKRAQQILEEKQIRVITLSI